MRRGASKLPCIPQFFGEKSSKVRWGQPTRKHARESSRTVLNRSVGPRRQQNCSQNSYTPQCKFLGTWGTAQNRRFHISLAGCRAQFKPHVQNIPAHGTKGDEAMPKAHIGAHLAGATAQGTTFSTCNVSDTWTLAIIAPI